MNQRKILLVDDEPVFTRVMRDYLMESGHYEVRTENDPKQVLATARSFGPDLIFLDVIMPDMDGGEVASQLKNDPELKDVPIVFLTAIVSKEDVTRNGNVIGGRSFLAKPVDAKDLVACVEKELRSAA